MHLLSLRVTWEDDDSLRVALMARGNRIRASQLRQAAVWWNGPSGRLLQERAAGLLSSWTRRLGAENVLQLGQPVFWPAPPDAGRQTWVLLNDGFACSADGYLQAYGDCSQLPFSSMRFDLVIVPFCLARLADRQAVLKECWRVLRPEGHILILDFNPAGSLGVQRRWRMWRRDRSWPWRRPFLSVTELRRLMENEGFSLCQGRYFQYTLPGLRHDAHWMELVGDRWWPAGANAYLLLGQRRETASPLVGLAEHRRLRTGGRLRKVRRATVPAAARSGQG